MSDDIVARLRDIEGGYGFRAICREAADEIERLRRELGQVSDADSWVSKADAAILDSLLNWCEFNEMDSHRALQRLVNDRARLRAEVIRLRAGGCARDQTTTQFCAEAEPLRSERDEARRQTRRILNEIDCRIEHGAESNGHLEAIRNLFEEATDGK